MNDGFDDERDSSHPPSERAGYGPELNARQREIHQNLRSIGPEIAAYYLDGIRILQREDLETSASLLAHVAREIDGGLRDVLSSEEAKKHIQSQLTEAVLTKFGNYSELKDRKGHIASILAALGIDDVLSFLSTDNVRVDFAARWINVSIQFHRFAHRHGAWRSPRRIEEFEGLWLEFEGVLAGLVGNYLNLLDRLDRIWTAEPTKERIGALRNLLESEARRAYFFTKLESPTWLDPLKEAGWFNPDRNPILHEDPDQPGNFYYPTWHALEYLAKVSSHSEISIGVLVDIVNAIINYTDDNGERIENDRTDLQIINIIGTLPMDRLEFQHITFMRVALKSKWKYGLVDQEIGQTILPKLLNGGEQRLTLALLAIMLETGSVNGQIRPVMDGYWLEDALKMHTQAIANLCGVEAVQVALTHIRTVAATDAFAFHFIQRIESDLALLLHADYAELLVSFTSSLFQFAEPKSIEETVQGLLQESHVIIRRIAIKSITDHYSNLKHLFWGWEGNPLDEIELKLEMYQLIQINSNTFDEGEMERMLQWIESTEN